MGRTFAFLVAVAMTALVSVGVVNVATAGSAPKADPASPVKAFINVPESYPDIIGGCVGKNGWYSTQGPQSQFQIIPNDANCVAGVWRG